MKTLIPSFILATIVGFLTSPGDAHAAGPKGCSVTRQFEQVCHMSCDNKTSCECSQGDNSICECSKGGRLTVHETGKNMCRPPTTA